MAAHHLHRPGCRSAVVFGPIAGGPDVGSVAGVDAVPECDGFGTKDRQFDTDVGFYVFRLPFLSFLVGWLFARS